MKRCLSLLLLALALAVPATANATTYGAEVGGDFFNQIYGIWNSSQVASSLNSLYAAGGRVGRADSDWAGTEPKAPVHGAHTYNWNYNDMIVSEMAQARVRWEPTLEFTPRWAQERGSNKIHVNGKTVTTPLPPAKNANFAAYATAFMHRYGPHGSFWAANKGLPYLPVNTVEVWNEPDNSHTWGPHIDLQDYAKMYEAVRTAIHRVSRGTKVMTGGLAWTRSSLPRLLKAFERKPMDEVAVHPYASNPGATVALAKFAISEMRKFGRGRTPLAVNEYGWTSQRNTWGSANPKNVNKYAYNALIGLSKLRLAQILPFEWTDASWGLSNGGFAKAVSRITHGRL